MVTTTVNDIEVFAVGEFLRDAASHTTRRLFDYLNTNVEQHPELAGVIPIVGQAAKWYGAGDPARAFTCAYQAHRAVILLRLYGSPNLPPL